ncbi:MAG: Ig-like domain-containing protein [Gemmatimonadaceae bacterium]
MYGKIRGSLRLYASAASLALVACDAPTLLTPLVTPDLAPALATASRVSTPVTLAVGDSLDIKLTSALAQYAVRDGKEMTWSSSAASVATVSPQGIVRGVKLGSSMVVLKVLKMVDSIPVTVAGAVPSLTASASQSSIPVGQTAQISVVAKDKYGVVIANPPLSFSSSNTASATASGTGLVTGIGAGSPKITVTSGSVSTTVPITITSGSPPPPPPSGGTVLLPAPPQLLNFTYPKVTGTTWTVASGGNLQAALNGAQRGDEIVIAAGATFTGTYTLPAKPGTAANGWILVRSDKSSQLPPQGTRVTSGNAGAMPKLVTPSVYPVLQTAAGASGWWISGVELTMSTTLTAINYGLVLLGDGTGSQSQLSQVPSDIVLDRVYIHAHPTTRTTRCIALNSARTAIQDSYVHECHLKGFDSQAIAGWNGPGPFKIVNNTLAGAGENMMFGGSDPYIPNLIPSDIEIRQNYIYTPANWRTTWTKKNLFEGKNMQRVLLEANILDGSWVDAQVGYAVLLKSVNQSGRCTWCATRDVTIRGNIIRNAGAGFNLSGREGSNKNPIGGLLTRVLIEQNVVENIMVGQFVGDSKFIQLLQNLSELTVRSNTMTTTGKVKMFLSLGSSPAATNADFYNNVLSYGSYGLFSSAYSSGELSMQNVASTRRFTGNVLIGPAKSGYPNSVFAASLSAAQSTGAGANVAAVTLATSGVAVP